MGLAAGGTSSVSPNVQTLWPFTTPENPRSRAISALSYASAPRYAALSIAGGSVPGPGGMPGRGYTKPMGPASAACASVPASLAPKPAASQFASLALASVDDASGSAGAPGEPSSSGCPASLADP